MWKVLTQPKANGNNMLYYLEFPSGEIQMSELIVYCRTEKYLRTFLDNTASLSFSRESENRCGSRVSENFRKY